MRQVLPPLANGDIRLLVLVRGCYCLVAEGCFRLVSSEAAVENFLWPL